MTDIILVIAAYFIGNISFSYLLAKRKLKADIRDFGSGNAGTTNVLRVMGKKYAIPVFIADALKGIIVVLLSKNLATSDFIVYACGIAVIVGHNWPALLGFRGGKGVATSIGVFSVSHPIVAVVVIITGVLVVVVTKMVSLGSVTGLILLPVILILFSAPKVDIIFGCIVAVIGVYQHRSNIKRLLNGTENKLGQKK